MAKSKETGNGMKAVTIRLEKSLIDRLNSEAEADHRTVTNLIETILIRALDTLDAAKTEGSR